MTLVLGMDVGGTTTRAVLVDAAGTVVGSGRAGGGNPVHDLDAAVAAVTAAVAGALDGHPPAAVGAVVIGMAGGDIEGRDVDVEMARALRDLGIRAAHRRTSDVAVAFAAGSAEPDGSVLVAGTGAVAGSIRGYELVGFADGHGWLLGDRGSGVWIGLRAVRHLLAALDGGGALSTTDTAVLAALDVPARRAALFAAVYAAPPAVLAGLAPVVLAGTDEVAAQIVAAAAGELLGTAAAVRATPGEPLVLAGGLLESANPLAAAVRTGAATRWPDAAITVAGDAARAAAWLGWRDVGTRREAG